MHVVYLYADSPQEWNCSEWRCHLLANAINAVHEANPKGFPHTANLYNLRTSLSLHHPLVQRKIGAGDIVLFQRDVIFPEVYDAMEYWRAVGKTVLVDLDDHYPGIPPSNPAHPFWIDNQFQFDPPPIERMTEGLRHADGLISPSHEILADWADVVPGYYWPNYPALKLYEGIVPKPLGEADVLVDYEPDASPPVMRTRKRLGTEGQICIGWGGSISHIDGFVYSQVLPALKRILADFPQVFFKFCGSETRLDYLLNQLPEKQLLRHGGVAADHWPLVVSTFDIGIAPLDLRPTSTFTSAPDREVSYDERRSWLKLVEYVCCGVPFVASDGAPYRELGRYGKLVPSSEDAWYDALAERIRGLEHYKAEAQGRKAWALKRFTMEANAERLIALYARIASEQQSRRANARLPETIYVE
jgi:glycosyltransferase involved in cell wall biosynthesis